jgi:predicted membrane chloride channel (bestrophin family)
MSFSCLSFVTAPGTLDKILQPKDLISLQQASSMPLHCIEALMSMTRVYTSADVPVDAKRAMNMAVGGLMAPFVETKRIKDNPVAFAYISHLRLLLMAYLLSMPLALVENLGWSTVPVYMAISYALMGLEHVAVEVENPFSSGEKLFSESSLRVEGSDLRIDDMNMEIADMIRSSFLRWQRDSDEDVVNGYSTGFSKRMFQSTSYKYW